MHLIAQGINRRPEVRHFDTNNKICFPNCRRSTLRLIEWMQRRKVHPPALIDDGGLQGLGKFDEQRHRRRRPRQAVGNEHRIFRRDQKACEFVDRARFSLRRGRHC